MKKLQFFKIAEYFELSRNNPSVTASPCQLPCRGALEPFTIDR